MPPHLTSFLLILHILLHRFIRNRLVQLDLNVDAGRQLELHERVDRLVGRVDDVHETLVRAQLVLVARVLVDVRRDQHRETLHLGRQRHGTLHGRTGTLRRIHDFARRRVDQAVIERLQADANVLIRCHTNYPGAEGASY